MSEAKKYDKSYKEQSVKLALEIEVKRASEELKVPYGTLYGWVRQRTATWTSRSAHRKRNEPGGGDPSAAKRGKAAEQGKQSASGGKGFFE